MHFQNFHDFLLMGGYAPYVWSAYGITFVVLLVNFLIPFLKNRNLIKNEKNASRT